ncbi:hypothetical protein BB561_006058 [Smittium simulii]|uniref:Integrase catalytic domain-containing protein n=1 Tax=Smittium simulii TaxID=133385 RepID=A0A2T9Y6X5_9FUNG|nr:hypothetical protein BB561_006058 [Smittium simulii]
MSRFLFPKAVPTTTLDVVLIFVKKLERIFGVSNAICIDRAASYQPKWNSQVERFNGELCQPITKSNNHNLHNWDPELHNMLLGLRSRKLSATNFSPAEILKKNNEGGLQNQDARIVYLENIEGLRATKERKRTSNSYPSNINLEDYYYY